MDAHLFRRLCDDLIPALAGVRIEKIHQLTSGVIIFTLYGLGKLQGDISLFGDKKQSLVLKSGREPLLFLSDHRPTIGTHPPAFIMRLRKYCAGKRIMRAKAHWIERKIYLEMSSDVWLCLGLKNGVELFIESAPNLDITEPIWPDFEFVYSLCKENKTLKQNIAKNLQKENEKAVESEHAQIEEARDTPDTLMCGTLNTHDTQVQNTISDIWRQYPVLTPLLRNTLPVLEKEEGAALYADLEHGGGDVAVYTLGEERVELSPWLLPQSLLKKMELSSKAHTSTDTALKSFKELLFEDAVSALKYAGAATLTRLSQNLKSALVKPLLNEAKRLDKLFLKLQKEEERLNAMLAKKEDALLLQAHLYTLDSKAKQKTIYLADNAKDGKERSISLDPAKTIGENMEYFFHVAGRGKRGLAHLAIRREALALQKKEALQNVLEESALQKGFEGQKNDKKNEQKEKAQGTLEKISHNKGSQFNAKKAEKIQTKNTGKNPLVQHTKTKQKFPPQVQAFRSSDGFLILRGRDTKGNGLVLKMANAHDYWVHIAQGASAHVIIRRDHPEQDVPQRTLEEAGALAFLKSWQKEQDKGLVQYSLAKYIRPMKAGKGLVHVDKSEGTFLVSVQSGLEEKLGM